MGGNSGSMSDAYTYDTHEERRLKRIIEEWRAKAEKAEARVTTLEAEVERLEAEVREISPRWREWREERQNRRREVDHG